MWRGKEREKEGQREREREKEREGKIHMYIIIYGCRERREERVFSISKQFKSYEDPTENQEMFALGWPFQRTLTTLM